eukprot:scaffold81_cov115-Isochrysis_galbana.AAC.4
MNGWCRRAVMLSPTTKEGVPSSHATAAAAVSGSEKVTVPTPGSQLLRPSRGTWDETTAPCSPNRSASHSLARLSASGPASSEHVAVAATDSNSLCSRSKASLPRKQPHWLTKGRPLSASAAAAYASSLSKPMCQKP